MKDIVEDGKTGYLVENNDDMSQFNARAKELLDDGYALSSCARVSMYKHVYIHTENSHISTHRNMYLRTNAYM